MRRVALVLTAAAGVFAGAQTAPDRPVPVLGSLGGFVMPSRGLYPPGTPMDSNYPYNRLRWRLSRVEAAAPPEARVLWNFTTTEDVSEWAESSDGTERQAGMSTGAFKLQRTARFQRAVMFSLLNPQPNGAGFVGFYAEGSWDLSQYNTILVTCRAQGQAHNYKVYLKTNSTQPQTGGAYESYYELPDNEFTTVSLPLSSFKYYYRGRLMPDAPPLDASAIYRIGLQVYGGVYQEVKQRGASTLEIDSIVVDNQ